MRNLNLYKGKKNEFSFYPISNSINKSKTCKKHCTKLFRLSVSLLPNQIAWLALGTIYPTLLWSACGNKPASGIREKTWEAYATPTPRVFYGCRYVLRKWICSRTLNFKHIKIFKNSRHNFGPIFFLLLYNINYKANLCIEL